MRLNLFGLELGFNLPRAEEKQSATSPLIYIMYQGTEVRGAAYKRNPAQYSDDAYKRNVVAFKAINEVSRGAAKIPLKVMIGEREADRSHPLRKLLAKPNPWQAKASFFEAVAAYWMLAGNSYIEGVGPNRDGAPPLELWPLRPDRTKVRPGPAGPAGYTYEVNGQIKSWEVDPITGAGAILHMRFFNPLDDWYGMSPVEAAAYSVDAHNMAGEWNQALLQNGCRPSGALVYKGTGTGPAILTEKQFSSLKEQVNSAYAGGRNSGRPMILDGGLEWQQMSLNPSEMDWISGKSMSAREIALAFGVPPQCLGIPGDNTYSNYQEARQALYQDTIVPLMDSLMDGLNGWLAPLYGPDVRIVLDLENLPALAGVREKRWGAVQNATWMTTNEKRQAVGLPIIEKPEADVVLVPSMLVPLDGMLAEPDGDETMPGEDGKVPPGLKPAIGDGDEEAADDGTDEAGDDPATAKPGKAMASAINRLLAKAEAMDAAADDDAEQIPEPIHTFDVPYGAGMAYDGDDWFIDRGIPLVLAVRGTAVNLVPLWFCHEKREHDGINQDEEYPEAHEQANQAERAAFARLYPDLGWADYDAACQVVLDACRKRAEACGDECAYSTPPTLDHRQYQEEGEIGLLHLDHQEC